MSFWISGVAEIVGVIVKVDMPIGVSEGANGVGVAVSEGVVVVVISVGVLVGDSFIGPG